MAQPSPHHVPLLTASMAQLIVSAAFSEAQRDCSAVTVTVVDRSGQTLAVLRDHRAGVHTLPRELQKGVHRLLAEADDG
ncbi:heme-binding protein [Rubrivirga sp. S365]|uniref:Heme-binding protein n=1 Tax=Rubrivirga litoralis TaxID=3075598 RepID=A0ABU3BTE4_9BACT|nr:MULTISPECIES: heme-binding protein [unclassified Rubrivirga]MDT0632564.1 heme-binding protein [Rubrivirga sp. F394]MDT7856748.1 heme-binding protein [Rubrivirga sp. S365]